MEIHRDGDALRWEHIEIGSHRDAPQGFYPWLLIIVPLGYGGFIYKALNIKIINATRLHNIYTDR